METMSGYFARPDTPVPGSPVGELMIRIVGKNSGVGFEEARVQANTLQQKAAGKWRYQMPIVRSPEEEAKRREDMRKAFKPLASAA
jgi:hypothetical protein